jgi:hypothetical protein
LTATLKSRALEQKTPPVDATREKKPFPSPPELAATPPAQRSEAGSDHQMAVGPRAGAPWGTALWSGPWTWLMGSSVGALDATPVLA